MFLFQLYGDVVHILYILIYVKEIVFTCVIYAANISQPSGSDITDFASPESCCNLSRSIPTYFQVLGQIVIIFLLVWVRPYTRLFWTSGVSYTRL